MTTGHMYLVAHPRNGDPLHATYAVAGSDQQATLDVLTAGLSREEGIDILYARALSADEITKLGLKSGQFRSFWPTKEL